MTTGSGPWDGTGPPPGGHFRASDVDREHVIDVLKTAFTEGRLTKDEYDTRLGQVFVARTYADLGAITSDLPAPQAPSLARHDTYAVRRPPGPARINSLARTALILGLVQAVVPPLGIAAIIVGTRARRQILRTGEAGDRMAAAGVVLGWIGVVIILLSMIAGVG